MAFGLPINKAIQRLLQSARELDESANKAAKKHDQHARSNFGQHIAAAVTNKLRPRAAMVGSVATAPKAEDESFGQRIAQAARDKVARVTRPRTGVCATTTQPSGAVSANSDGDEGFAKRLKEAAEKKSGATRHKEYTERERDRYEQQRKRAIGE
jgi:hypothetical protein